MHTSDGCHPPTYPCNPLQELEHASSERWPECTKHGMEVCNLLWAMAAWQYTPSRTWLGAALMQAARLLPSLSPGGLASLLLSLADLDFTPPTDWASAALEQVHMRVVRDRRPAQRHELVAVLWAVSRFVRPNGALRTAQAAAAVGMAGSLAALGQLPEAVVGRPERKWMLRYRPVLQDLCDLMQAQLQLLSPEQLLDVAVALADLTYYPGVSCMQQNRCI